VRQGRLGGANLGHQGADIDRQHREQRQPGAKPLSGCTRAPGHGTRAPPCEHGRPLDHRSLARHGPVAIAIHSLNIKTKLLHRWHPFFRDLEGKQGNPSPRASEPDQRTL
jgi:hypothetical protein